MGSRIRIFSENKLRLLSKVTSDVDIFSHKYQDTNE
jgi:hypothetical protein